MGTGVEDTVVEGDSKTRVEVGIADTVAFRAA